jgi:hypothetical protein
MSLERVIALNVLRHTARNDMNLNRSQVRGMKHPDTGARSAGLLLNKNTIDLILLSLSRPSHILYYIDLHLNP